MNTYYKHLMIPFDFKPVYPKDNSPMTSYDLKKIPDEMTRWLDTKNLEIVHGEVFYLSPAGVDSLPIHIDGAQIDDHVKINFVYCDTPSFMNWYNINDETKLVRSQTPIGTNYISANLEDCEKVCTAEIGQPSLVNVGRLHDISSVQSDRYCFSFVLKEKASEINLQWNRAIELLG